MHPLLATCQTFVEERCDMVHREPLASIAEVLGDLSHGPIASLTPSPLLLLLLGPGHRCRDC